MKDILKIKVDINVER
jgi:hypothetical protein